MSDPGANASLTLYCLIETATPRRLEPCRYLKYMFTRLPLARTPEGCRTMTLYHLDTQNFVCVVS